MRDDGKAIIIITHNGLKKKGRNLEFASERLRKKSNVVTEAVKSDGTALEFALYIDKPIVLTALAENIDAVKFIPAELKKDLDIAETVAGTAPEKLSFFPFAVKNNCNVAKKAVEVNGMTLGIFSKKIRKNPRIVKKAVGQNGLSLQFVDAKLKESDYSISLEAVKNDGMAWIYVPEIYKDREEITKTAFESNILVARYLPLSV